MRYRHTQVGWLTIGLLGLVAAVAFPLLLTAGETEVTGMACAVLAVVLALFATLTVEVDDTAVTARFGIGLIRRRIPLEEVRSFAPVRNRWYYGWGIRLIPGGWMFNVSGLGAVELVLESGKRFRIGSDEPLELARALERVLGQPAPLSPEEARIDRRRERRIALLIGGLVAIVLGGVGLVLWGESRPPRISLSESTLSVESFIYHDELPLAEIEGTSLEERLPEIASRTNGTALGSLLRGTFRLADGTRARIYVDASAPPFVFVRHAQELLVFHESSAAATRALFERLGTELAGD